MNGAPDLQVRWWPRAHLIGLRAACCALLCAAVLGVAGAASAASAVPPRLNLYVGDAQLLDIEARRVVVGNGKLVSVTHLDQRQLLVLAEAPGSTKLQIWERGGGWRELLVVVSEFDVQLLLEQVESLLAGTRRVQPRAGTDRVLLDGAQLDERARERVALIVKTFPGRVVDLTSKVGWDDMLLLEVRLVELRRSASSRLGIRWNDGAAGPNARWQADSDGARHAVLRWDAELASRLEAMRAQGEARVLAEPTLSCRSGGVARFVSGGELPVPVLDAQGTPNVQFREYGVVLDIKPSVDEQGYVQAEIDTELSDIDPSVQVMGVPGLLKRRSTTEVNLRLGETMVLAGLLSRGRGRDESGLPGLSRVPLAGGLFRSRSRAQQDTELVFFITPRRLESAPAEAVPEPNRHWLERGAALRQGTAP